MVGQCSGAGWRVTERFTPCHCIARERGGRDKAEVKFVRIAISNALLHIRSFMASFQLADWTTYPACPPAAATEHTASTRLLSFHPSSLTLL